MLTARQVLIATLLIAALSLVGMAISLWRSLEPGQLGGDTYGTRAHGQRGVFELLSELKIPVERSLLPPDGSRDRSVTLVVWEPHRSLVDLEPAYFGQILNWVKAGGRLVIALPGPDVEGFVSSSRSRHQSEHDISVLEELGLPKVRTTLVNLDEPPAADGEPANPPASESTDVQSPKKPEKRRDFLWLSVRESTTETVQASCGGDLQSWQESVAKLEVPLHQLQVLDTTGDEPAGWLKINTAEGSEETLVASYRVGGGEIVLVGDAEPLENRLLGHEDNALLAWRLLVVDDRAVVWDEFYHGLTIRGNPLYLLRREPFGALTVAILILIAVGIWRQAVRFGPAAIIPPLPRRTLTEYIETMARLFERGRHSQPFLLTETRNGMLWLLRSELGLNLGQEKLETIVAVLRRKRPEQAARLAGAVDAIDRALATGRDLSERDVVLILQRISSCL